MKCIEIRRNRKFLVARPLKPNSSMSRAPP
jgi:hypothetical protein